VLRQTVAPHQVIVSAVDLADWGENAVDSRVQIILGDKGLTRQRNRGIAALDAKCEIVTMLDDDVELPEDYFEAVHRLFTKRPDVALCFGAVRDAPGASREDARQIITRWPPSDEFKEGAYGLGCSMNIRRKVLDHINFDERLPLYGWLEDADFAARARPFGLQGVYNACRTVHLLEQKMRLSGVRFGYSQVMNPYYLWRKGSIPFKEVLMSHWFKGMASNLLGAIRRDPSIDRWGRLRGSVLAIWFIVLGRVEPEFVERL
jgi:hypothetical protein